LPEPHTDITDKPSAADAARWWTLMTRFRRGELDAVYVVGDASSSRRSTAPTADRTSSR
jgi:hypothetical protein